VHHSLLFEELLLINADSRGVVLTCAHAVALSWVVKIPAPAPWHVTLLRIIEDASYMALCRLTDHNEKMIDIPHAANQS
jgi:hypothetical protein